MKAQEIYNRAESQGVYWIGTCVSMSPAQCDAIMNKTTQADAIKVERIIKQNYPDLINGYYNPYRNQCRKSKNYIVWVHSAIEYFFKIN